MRFKKWLYALLIAAMACTGAATAACSNGGTSSESSDSSIIEEQDAPEAGVYYFEADGAEYLITLSSGRKFALSINGANESGRYSLDGDMLVFSFDGEESKEISAVLKDDVLTLTYENSELRFLKRLAYTVSFDVDGGSAVGAVSVINGKTLSKPADPSRSGYVFIGWYTDASYTTAFAFDSQIVTSDMTLYARWGATVPGQAEYSVSFDLNYDGAQNPEAQQTVGGKLYRLPEPERSGYTFKGWWVSMYEDASKLSYQYTEDTVFKADSTLFAVWQEDSVASAPMVYVGPTGISWDQLSAGATLKITGPAGFSTIEQSIGATAGTSYTLNFASAPAGDYVIELSSGDSTVVRWYRNKALDRVSGFTVVGNSMLLFAPVGNAEKYIITVECGNEKHTHTLIDNGNSTNYNFAACEMKEGGIKFIVYAEADGYASSVPSEFIYNNVLSEVTGYYLDEETDTLVWNAVENAAGYVVSVNGGEPVDIGNRTSIGLKEYTGEIVVSVYPKTKGYNSPAPTVYTYLKEALSTPGDIRITGDVLSWGAVENATSYEIRIGAQVLTADENTLDLEGCGVNWTLGTDYRIEIRAKGTVDSLWSDAFDARYYAMYRTLTYSRGIVSWRPVIGAVSYEVTVNGGAAQIIDTGKSEAEITFTKSGYNTISVRYYDGSEYSEEAVVSVYAYAVTLDSRGGASVNTQYKAIGDRITLPETTYNGYDFAGWYNVPGGADSNGSQYADEYFTGNGDLVLYAYWMPKTYTVSLNYGAYGEGTQLSEDVVYNRDYALPVPTVNDPIKVFLGWYGTADGNGVKYTDELGTSVSPWPHASENITVYAYYVDAIDYIEDGDGYSVKAGTYIGRISNLVIPAEYNGKKVVSIYEYGFLNCTKLITVSIPDTVRTISDTAFDGCTYIQSFIIRAEGEADPVYSSVDGTILYDNRLTGANEIAFVPSALTGTYYVPDGVTRITPKTFNRSKLTEIIIPSSVVSVAKDAFVSCTALTTITFTESFGAETSILEMDPGAISSTCTKLTTITFPERLRTFESDETVIFSAFKNLVSINVESTSANRYYSSIDGVLCNASGSKLIYCPIGRTGSYTVPAAITEIGPNAFNAYVPNINYSSAVYNGVTEVIFHSNITSIGEQAFYQCRKLETVIFKAGAHPAGFTIGEKAFYYCTSLSTITFEETGALESSTSEGITTYNYRYDTSCGVISIGELAFYYCAESELLLPSTLVQIGVNAFQNNKNLVKIDFSHVRSDLIFENYVFNSCTALTQVEFTDNVGIINFNSVFYLCSKLKTFTVSENNPNYEDDEDGVLYNRGKTEIVYYPEGLTGNYVIPESVVRIGGGVFRAKTNITEIVITKNITYIGASAFESCPNLVKVVFEEGGTEDLIIDDRAFYNCTSLPSIALPARTKSIGSYCFRANTLTSALTSVTLNEGLEEIGEYAFANCSVLTSITIPSTVKSIGNYAFAYSKIENVSFAPAAEGAEVVPLTFGSYIFYYASALEEIALPERLQYIPDNAFNYAQALRKVTIPTTVGDSDSARGVGTRAFYNCVNLSELVFTSGGDKPLSFAGEVFQKCTSLKVLNLPARISGYTGAYDVFEFGDGSILSNANAYTSFYTYNGSDAAGLERINVEDGGLYFSSYDGILYTANRAEVVFCPIQREGVVTISKDAVTIRECAFYYCGKVTSIVFEEGGTEDFYLKDAASPTSISSTQVFRGCISLESIYFPARLTKIGAYALYRDTSMMTTVNGVTTYTTANAISVIEFAEGCRLAEIGNYAFSKTFISSIVLPGEVTTIGTKPFEGCANLTKITVSKSMNEAAFTAAIDSCTTLKEVIVPEDSLYFASVDGVLYNKDKTTLVYCPVSKVAEVYTIPATVTSIPANAFLNVAGIQKIEFEPSELALSIGQKAFSASGIESIELPARLSTMDTYAFYNCENLKTVTFEDGYSYGAIPNYTFNGCTSLMSIAIPDCVTKIGILAFSECSSLSAVTFGENSGLQSIGQKAFNACTSLLKVTIPSGVKNFGELSTGTFTYTTSASTFAGCTSLFEVDLSQTKIEYIAMYTFQNCSSLVTVKLPSTLKGIYSYAFDGCSKLASIDLDTVDGAGSHIFTILGGYAFRNCISLTSVTVPETVVTYVTGYAFQGCTSLLEATFNAAVTTNGLMTGTFDGCTSLRTVNIGAAVTVIGNYGFRNCTSLTTVNFASGNSLSKLGTYAFQNCTSLESITLPSTVTNLGATSNTTAYTFDGCTALKSLEIPSGVTVIGQYTFRNCTSLSEMDLGNMKIIGTYAFQNCTSLSEITIPSTVTTYGTRPFDGCTGLVKATVNSSANLPSNMFAGCSLFSEVTLNSAIKTIGTYAFQNCTSLESIVLPASLTTLGTASSTSASNVFEGCTSLKSIEIPAGVTVIAKETFSGCTALSSVTLNNVTTIGPLAFAGCANLSFSIPEDGVLQLENGAIYNGTSLIYYYGTGTSLTVRDGTTEIGSYAFQNNATLTQVILPDTLEKIGTYAFQNCIALETIALPSSLTSFGVTTYSASACTFDGCSSLKEIAIPAGVSVLGAYSFRNCTSLAKVDLGSITILGSYAFQGCTALTEITVPASVTTIGSTAFASSGLVTATIHGTSGKNNSWFESCSDLETVIFDGAITTFGNYVFRYCSSLKNITLPATLATSSTSGLGDYATGGLFIDCISLESITIPAGITVIPAHSFRGCVNLKTVTCLGTITAIGANAFQDCTALTIADMDFSQVTIVRPYAFWNCASIESISLPALKVLATASTSLTSPTQPAVTADSYVFAGCTNLKEVVLPDTITIIAKYTFSGCSSLSTLVMPGVTSIGEGAFEGCSSLSGFDLGKVTNIGAGAFKGCTGISELTLTAVTTTIGAGAFEGWTEEQKILVPDILEAEAPWAEGWNSDCEAAVVWKEAPAEEEEGE